MTTPTQPGPDLDLTINGTSVVLPAVLEVHNVLAQSLTPSATRPRVDAWYAGEGMPNVQDKFEWVLEYQIDSTYAAMNLFLEKLRTKGGVHLAADWKARAYTYTTRSGQQFFYLPRQDAFSLGYAGHTVQATYGATATRNGVALTVLYKPTVSAGDAVPTGELWISNAAVVHPETGLLVAPFKVGTTNALYDEIVVIFHALYRVAVSDLPTHPFRGGTVREDKALYLVEVAGG